MNKPDPRDGPDEKKPADILPFRAAAKPTPARTPVTDDEETVEPLSTSALVRIALFVVFLIAVGVWLMDTLRNMGRLEDCAMQGRRNCAPISTPYR